MALETISQYLQDNDTVYGFFMDCTKAFDTVKYSILFQKLLDAKIPPVIVRLIIHMYQKQSPNVRWEGKLSRKFNISNGVKQGSVLSPILFCFYMNNLFSLMKNNKTGCHVGNYFAGLFGYADDLFIISHSRKGLQEMVTVAEKYAEYHNIKFSTNPDPVKSKTKGIIFTSSSQRPNINRETKNITTFFSLFL